LPRIRPAADDDVDIVALPPEYSTDVTLHRALFASALVMATALALVSPAAPSYARPADGVEAEALERIDRGVTAFRAGDFATAEREFEAAQRLAPSKANPYRWLGMTAAQRGDCARAVRELDTFLSLVPATDDRVPEVHRVRAQCIAGAPAPTAQPTPAPPALVSTAAPPPEKPPLHRRWWLWTLVGGAAAATVVGVTLGVVLRPAEESRLPTIVCAPTTGCARGAM
jgi:tetratricopeptide (TPR) repeat protein